MADKKDQVERQADDLDVTQFVEIKQPSRPAVAKMSKHSERTLDGTPDEEKQKTLRAKQEKKRRKEVKRRYGEVQEDTVNLAKSLDSKSPLEAGKRTKSTATTEEESIGVILQKGHDAGQNPPVASTPKSTSNTTYKVETVWIKDNAVRRFIPNITPAKSPAKQ